MKTLKEFDYDLWTTEDSQGKHYWTKVKVIGEAIEVSHEVMKFLRSEEKKMRREIEEEAERGGADLSLDTLPVNDEGEFWIKDPANLEEDVLECLRLEEFRQLLTPPQLSIFDECLCGHTSQVEYAIAHGIRKQSVLDSIKLIQKKAKKFFCDT